MAYKRSTLLLLMIALVLSIAAMAIIAALTFDGTDGGFGMMQGGSWGWTMAFMAVPAIILVVIVVVVVGGFEDRPAYDGHQSYAPQQSALEILNQRYARGEVSHEEYERIRRNLGQ